MADRLIANNSVPINSADVVPGSGTPQFATSGNPIANVPATVWPAYKYNEIQEELRSFVVAGHMTPRGWDGTQASVQAWQAALAMGTMVDVGSTNALSVSPPVPLPTTPSQIPDGTILIVIPAATTTSANPTLSVSGGAASAIGAAAGIALALQPGAIVKNVPVALMKQTQSGQPVWWVVTYTSPGTTRPLLTTNLNVFVATTGNDTTGNGTSGAPWATLAKAASYIQTLDTGGNAVTVNVANGTYTSPFIMTTPVTGGGSITITGNPGAPTNVLISTTNLPCFQTAGGITVNVSGFSCTAGGSTQDSRYCLIATGGSLINFNHMNFAAASDSILYAFGGGQVNGIGANFTTSDNTTSPQLVGVNFGGQININGANVTFGSNNSFSAATAFANNGGHLELAVNSWGGGFASVVGQRYSAINGASIYTAGGGASWVPGNSPGSPAPGGSNAGFYA